MSNRFLKNRFRSIIDKYLKGASTAEQQKLVDYFYDSIQDEELSETKLAEIERGLKENIDRRIRKQGRIRRLNRQRLFLKIASAVVVLAISSIYIYNLRNRQPDTTVVAFEGKKQDIEIIDTIGAPVLVLDDGQSYSIADRVFEQLDYRLIDGERVFIIPDQLSLRDNHEQKLSQVKNPTDKVFAFLLEDGTTAWLNPNSTLEILPDMDGKRMVHIQGTVLFDVQRVRQDNGYKPFVVKTALQTIEVLGTKFIVNSMGKLEDILLLEGKVKVTHNKYKTALVLQPNQKASLKEVEANILVTKSSDNYKVEAWHKGLFHFENEKIADVLSEISQWYSQEIIVDEAIRDIPITGMVSRYKNIDEVLELIELTNNITYRRQERSIYVE